MQDFAFEAVEKIDDQTTRHLVGPNLPVCLGFENHDDISTSVMCILLHPYDALLSL